MNDLLTMLNHLAAAWLARPETQGGALNITHLELDSQGGRATAWVQSGGFRGEVLLRLHVEPAQGTRHTLRLEIEQWPEKMPAALEPLRRTLESARIQIEVDLGA